MAMPPSIHLSCLNPLEANFAKGKKSGFIDSPKFYKQNSSSNEIIKNFKTVLNVHLGNNDIFLLSKNIAIEYKQKPCISEIGNLAHAGQKYKTVIKQTKILL